MIYRFSPRQLLCMAGIIGKDSLFGIENDFSRLSIEELPAVFQEQMLALVEQGAAAMDMDGRFSLRSESLEIIQFVCECDQCMSLTVDGPGTTGNRILFWRRGNRFLMGEQINGYYVFSKADAAMVRGCAPTVDWAGMGNQVFAETVLPRLALTKALRFCRKEQRGEAWRILRQNGADAVSANVIVDCLRENANYISLGHMIRRGEQLESYEKKYLSGRGIAIALSETIVNLRSCVVFSCVELSTVRAEITTMIDSFLAGIEEAN